MTTGGSCSAPSTGSKKLPRQISGGSRIRRLCPITGRWGLSSLEVVRRERAQRRKEVDSEARTLFPLCSRAGHWNWLFQRQLATMGASSDLAEDTGSQVAGVQTGAAEAH